MADYYELLGVARDADKEQIKRAYRKMALKHHPDRNQGSSAAEERFKEATRAYEVLKDPRRRAEYDRFGEAGPRGSGADIQSAMEIFMREFGGMGRGGRGLEDLFDLGAARTRRRPGSESGETVRIRVKLSLADVVSGITRKLRLALLERCDACSGSGSASGSRTVCRDCGGAGEVRRMQRSVFGQVVTVRPCSICGGEGRVASEPCARCSGEGRLRKEGTVEVRVPPGVTSENFLTLKGRGNAGRFGGPKGDIVVLLQVENDPRFERDGDTVIRRVSITFSQAALGDEIDVPTLDGRVKVEVPAGTQSGDTLLMKGLGLPELHGKSRGDQLLKVSVCTPDRLTKEQKAIFRELREVETAPDPGQSRPRTRKGLWERVKGALGG